MTDISHGSQPTGDVSRCCGRLQEMDREEFRLRVEQKLREQIAMGEQQVIDAAMLFPSLREGVPGICPWSPETLDTWASSHNPPDRVLFSAQFVLCLWSPEREWKCGRFDVFRAIASWDPDHKYAFYRWIEDPWFPTI